MLNNLQILRALAASLVVIHHARPFIKAAHPSVPWFNIGAVGVDLFFVISGFIMVYASGATGRTPAEFWRERAVRILPMYWFVTLTLVALYLAGFRPMGLHGWDAKDLAASLLLLPHVRIDGVREPIFTLGWTLIYEAFFYLVFGALLTLRDSFKIASALTVLFAGLWLGGVLLQPQSFAAQYYTSPLMLEFVGGAWLGIAYTRTRLFSHHAARRAGLIAIGAAAAAWIIDDYLLREMVWRSDANRIAFVGIPAVAMVAGALALERAGSVCNDARLLLLGTASYSIYLWHQFALQPVYKLLARILPQTPMVTLLSTIFAFACAIILGVAMYSILERPITRSLKRHLATGRPARTFTATRPT